MVSFGHPGLAYIFNFWHSRTLALRVPECQKFKMWVKPGWHWTLRNV